ncbi:MAG: thioredoxin domain-containing protein [Acidimicrobiia bacterium]
MPNQLSHSASPYLLQHKDNPVDWFEWGSEPFQLARERDVPVLLSVGYAACHWCHVMAHESFEDEETAEEMNRLFVNIKVDREERPDVDSIYMESVQAMSGHGGWPMTVWLDHDGRPFFAGTYFPNEPRHGMASFREVMNAVSTAWRIRRDDINEQAERLVAAISQRMHGAASPSLDTIQGAYEQVATSFDPQNGGFGGAPKFPQQPILEFLLRLSGETWAPHAREMLTRTLERIAAGGINDHVGGGFARYSVDARWLVPHFEKMLYDNAQLARLYMWAGIEFDRGDFVATARATLDYMIRDLRHPNGGFFSSEDADSEGEEGKFYVWKLAEIEALLGSETDVAARYFGITADGNFEGANILHDTGVEPPAGLDTIKKRLLDARSERVRPGLDDKVIASWNGLAIRAFAEAGAALADETYLDCARSAARFVLGKLMVDGRLMRSWREGRTSVHGFLEDHAAMACGLFSLYAATAEVEWYESAMDLVSGLARFRDETGTYFSTADDGEPLIKRPTDQTDNPLPSGNALAAEALLLASLYTGDHDLRENAEMAVGAVYPLMDRYPSMVGHHLSVAFSMNETKELAVVGDDWPRFANVFWKRFRPNIALAASATGTEKVPLLEGREKPGETVAYVCRGFVCDLPSTDPEHLGHQLS